MQRLWIREMWSIIPTNKNRRSTKKRPITNPKTFSPATTLPMLAKVLATKYFEWFVKSCVMTMGGQIVLNFGWNFVRIVMEIGHKTGHCHFISSHTKSEISSLHRLCSEAAKNLKTGIYLGLILKKHVCINFAKYATEKWVVTNDLHYLLMHFFAFIFAACLLRHRKHVNKCSGYNTGNYLIRGTIVNKAPLSVQFLLALGWKRGKAEASSSALLSKKGVGRERSIESQQKSDFFCSDIMPNW